MVKVNSLSGGKTSSYMAVHFPSDYELFALVCNEDFNCRPKDDFLVKYANKKLNKYCSHFGEFIGSPEDPKIFSIMYELEQMLGREIIWLRDLSFEQVCRNKKAIPNKAKRFCTSLLKIKPIFEFCYLYLPDVIEMRIGYRYDEKERKEKFTDTFKYSNRMEYQAKSQRWINRWEEKKWRIGGFPMIDEKIIHSNVKAFWDSNNIDFPKDSNCQMCFWKQYPQIQKNYDSNPEILKWASKLEEEIGYSFNDDGFISEIRDMPTQLEFVFNDGFSSMGCQSGFCTD